MLSIYLSTYIYVLVQGPVTLFKKLFELLYKDKLKISLWNQKSGLWFPLKGKGAHELEGSLSGSSAVWGMFYSFLWEIVI